MIEWFYVGDGLFVAIPSCWDLFLFSGRRYRRGKPDHFGRSTFSEVLK